MLEEGTAYNSKEIEEQASQLRGFEIRKGDVVLFYTGWINLTGIDNERLMSGAPGLGMDGAQISCWQRCSCDWLGHVGIGGCPSGEIRQRSSPVHPLSLGKARNLYFGKHGRTRTSQRMRAGSSCLCWVNPGSRGRFKRSLIPSQSARTIK